jgi:ureidoacrylate peracid hydrolase
MTKETGLPPIDAEGGLYRERAVELKHTALLSVDMQNMECAAALRRKALQGKAADARKRYFFDRIERVVIPNQRRLLAAARRLGIEVIYTTIESLTRDGRDRSLDHKISRIHAARGSWDGKVIDEVAPKGDEIIIPKTASGIFNSTNIEYVLRNLDVRYLVVFGILTEQCVESTVRDACDRGFMVTELEDCCATYSQENHDASVRAMVGHYCRGRTTDAMIAELEELARAGKSTRPAKAKKNGARPPAARRASASAAV